MSGLDCTVSWQGLKDTVSPIPDPARRMTAWTERGKGSLGDWGRPHARLLLVTILAASLAQWSFASSIDPLLPRVQVEDLRVGQFYQGGTRLRVPFLGISFMVPRDWRMRLPAGGQVLHMDSARKPGIGIALLLDEVTLDDLESRLAEPQAFEAAYVLDPTGPVERKGSRLSASYLHGDQVGRAVALLGTAGHAVVYLMAGPKEEAEYYETLVDQLAKSTQFVSRQTAERLRAWYERLSGQMLRAPMTPGVRIPEEWHLCDDGSFLHEMHNVSPASPDQPQRGFRESGTWRIDVHGAETNLIATPQNDLPRRFTLQDDGNHTYLESKPFLRDLSNRCL